MTLPDEFLGILACPRCRGSLEYRPADPSLVCHSCLLRYPVRDDIPILLIDEAEPLAATPGGQS